MIKEDLITEVIVSQLLHTSGREKNHFDNLMIHSRENIRFFSLASH